MEQLSLRWDNKHMLPVDLLPLSQYARQEVNQGGFLKCDAAGRRRCPCRTEDVKLCIGKLSATVSVSPAIPGRKNDSQIRTDV